MANSFFNAGTFKKHIPALYRLNAIDLINKNIKTKNLKTEKESNIKIYEWTKDK